MVIYLHHDDAGADQDRLGLLLDVRMIQLLPSECAVRSVVTELCRPDATALVLPDDYRRHNAGIEAVKACALHLGLNVYPVTHYLQRREREQAKNQSPAVVPAVPPAPQCAPVGELITND